jgi:hypothetical protein
MQVSHFAGGGVAVHKIRLSGSACRFSAWLDANGVLLDAERIDAAGRGYPVGILQRRELQHRLAHLAAI